MTVTLNWQAGCPLPRSSRVALELAELSSGNGRFRVRAAKRGGDVPKVSLDDWPPRVRARSVALDDAAGAEMVHYGKIGRTAVLRGHEHRETAEVLHVSHGERDWRFAKLAAPGTESL
jgi:hypothetical protein